MRPHLRALDGDILTWSWRHPDARMDALHQEVVSIARRAAEEKDDVAPTFHRIRAAARSTAGIETTLPDPDELERRYPRDRVKPPRLTEDWFC